MARYGQRPENALKRANEFIEVGKPARALDTLYEVFRNKKWAYNWSESVLEPIMFKYLDLCVELKKSHIAKEGLFQYRNMFQSVNVSSLENVIRGYLRTAEERTESAREQSQQAVIDIDDLDMLATPESILLSAVSGEDAQDRSDRTILTPWVKFLWESYCQCLELLRTNAHVETLYHDIARMAFSFCLKYNRKTEFRKLCDKLRKHLEDISKLPAQTVNVSIHKAETQQLNLDTRLVQLDSAIQMELWQEAYKAIEDIHGLMNLSKKPPVPKTMANYYQKLAMVFWKAGNYLFHAAALFKLFQLSKDMKKNITSEEMQRMACRVLLATLSIPLPSAHPEFDRFIETDKSPLEKAQRLAILLGLSQPPTRASLLKDIVRGNVVTLASSNLQDLYSWLEIEFDPLLLCERVNTVIEEIQATGEQALQQYVTALQDVTLVRLVRQLAQVYQTIQFSRLLQLSKFATQFHLERLLVDCVRHNDMQIRIDHGARCIHFGMDLSESQREDKPEGPTLQSMPSEQVRNQLINMASVLHRAMATINPAKRKLEREKLRAQLVQHYHDTKIREHQRILARHKIIEDRKEYLERMNTVREEEEARRQEDIARQQMMAEQKRLDMERDERERKRQENEIQQIKDRHLKEKMQQISLTSHGQKVLKKLDEEDIKKLDAEQIAAKEAEELQKERRELQQKLKSQEKKVDYFVRAKRIEEGPLLEKSFAEKQVADRKFWDQQESERIQTLVKERELAVQHRERLKRMKEDRDAFLERLRTERRSVYMDKLGVFEKNVDEERKKRLAERKLARKEERRQLWLKERAEAEERKRKAEEERVLEEARKKAEAEALALKLQKEKENEAYRKEKEKMDRQAEIQRQREAEAEEKFRRETEKSGFGSGGGGTSSWRRGGAPPLARDADRDMADGPKRDTGEWRKGGGKEPETSKPKASEPWRPARAREADGGSKPPDSWRRGDPEPRTEKENPDREKGPSPIPGSVATEQREKASEVGPWRSSGPTRDVDDKDRDIRGAFDRGGRGGMDRDGRGGMDRDGRGGMDRDGRGGMDRDGRGGMDRDGRGGMDRDGRGGMDREGRGGMDREGRGGMDREGRGGMDRDRGGMDRDGRGGFDRTYDRERRDDRGRGGMDRDGERGGDRSFGGGSSWRKKTADEAADDEEDRQGGMRRTAPMRSGPKDGPSDWRTAKDSGPPPRRSAPFEERRGGPVDDRRGDDGRRAGPPDIDSDKVRGEKVVKGEPLKENRPVRPAEPAAGEEGDDGNWQKVSRR